MNLILEEDNFTGKGDHDLDKITAYPGESVIYTTPEDRKKYKDYIPEKSPWINSGDQVPDGPQPYSTQ